MGGTTYTRESRGGVDATGTEPTAKGDLKTDEWVPDAREPDELKCS
jgi:hypothetical protein